jgi:hypothetical protein
MKINLLLVLLLSTGITNLAKAQTPKPEKPLANEVRLDATIVPKLAATLAATLANQQTKMRFDVEPFSPIGAAATLRRGRWEWQARVGYGKGDLHATVSFAQDGTQQRVEVTQMVNEL